MTSSHSNRQVNAALLGATVLTCGLNVWALQRVRTSRVALWIFLQPVVAASLDLALGSSLTPRFLGVLAQERTPLFKRYVRHDPGAVVVFQ